MCSILWKCLCKYYIKNRKKKKLLSFICLYSSKNLCYNSSQTKALPALEEKSWSIAPLATSCWTFKTEYKYLVIFVNKSINLKFCYTPNAITSSNHSFIQWTSELTASLRLANYNLWRPTSLPCCKSNIMTTR